MPRRSASRKCGVSTEKFTLTSTAKPRSAGVDRFDAPARTFQPVLILVCEKTSAALPRRACRRRCRCSISDSRTSSGQWSTLMRCDGCSGDRGNRSGRRGRNCYRTTMISEHLDKFGHWFGGSTGALVYLQSCGHWCCCVGFCEVEASHSACRSRFNRIEVIGAGIAIKAFRMILAGRSRSRSVTDN